MEGKLVSFNVRIGSKLSDLKKCSFLEIVPYFDMKVFSYLYTKTTSLPGNRYQ